MLIFEKILINPYQEEKLEMALTPSPSTQTIKKPGKQRVEGKQPLVSTEVLHQNTILSVWYTPIGLVSSISPLIINKSQPPGQKSML